MNTIQTKIIVFYFGNHTLMSICLNECHLHEGLTTTVKESFTKYIHPYHLTFGVIILLSNKKVVPQ